jgi:hypothetical protein
MAAEDSPRHPGRKAQDCVWASFLQKTGGPLRLRRKRSRAQNSDGRQPSHLLRAAASGHAAAPPSSVMNSRLFNRLNRIRWPNQLRGSISHWRGSSQGSVAVRDSGPASASGHKPPRLAPLAMSASASCGHWSIPHGRPRYAWQAGIGLSPPARQPDVSRPSSRSIR